MAKLRLYPHRTAAPDSVTWGPWWIDREPRREALPALLSGWDYASDEKVGLSVKVDEAVVLKSTGMSSTDDLEILATGDCAQVQRRFVERARLRGTNDDGTIDVRLHLPRGEVAGSVRLSAHLVCARTTQPSDNGTAFLRGARLHSSDPFTLRLEGDSSRFPTEPVPFSELGLGNAPWTVLTTYEALDDDFMGGVRLLVNTEHPIGQHALDPSTSGRFGRLLRLDVMRLLIASAADRALHDLPLQPADSSVAHVLESMCQLFLGRSLTTSARLYRDDPGQFELVLQDRLDPLSGLAS